MKPATGADTDSRARILSIRITSDGTEIFIITFPAVAPALKITAHNTIAIADNIVLVIMLISVVSVHRFLFNLLAFAAAQIVYRASLVPDPEEAVGERALPVRPAT